KTHLLHAVAQLARTVRPDLRVLHRDTQTLVDDLSSAVAAGNVDAFRDQLMEADLILLDDVQLLAGKARTQEELLRVWDEIVWVGEQIILAADRPPAEIAGIDEELRARLAGGLTVDISPHDDETRIGIVRQGAAERGIALGAGVDETLARLPLEGAKALQAGLDRIAVAQAEKSRRVEPGEVASIVGVSAAEPADEFSAFLNEIATTVEQLMDAEPWRKRLAEAILRWEGEGVRTRRLEAALEADSAPDVDALLSAFDADAARLRAIAGELARLDPSTAQSGVLTDPDRVAEAEAMLLSARASAERKAEVAAPAPPPVDRWYYNNAEKVDWRWIALDDRLMEELV
ncbi:MAG TPA: DnaA/Hda family protein, partial [Longimicrobium sp.]|nr:DnaA/Hda family protein [Longimicrobium sp.]